ncbi:hypothetical protein ACHAPJ_005352 [Fusarium lateritium]
MGACIFFLGIPTADRPMPKVTLTAEQIKRIPRGVVWRFHLAEQKSANVRGSIEKQIKAARNRDDHDKADQLEETIGKKSRNAFVETAAEILYGMIKVPSDQAVADLPSEPPSVQRAATAEALAVEPRHTADEEDDVWYVRVHAWVAENASSTLPMPPTGRTRVSRDAYPSTTRNVGKHCVI